MNPLGHIRHLRNLPRILLAVVVLAVAQTSLVPCVMASDSAPVMEHCVYCPPAAADMTSDCAFPHAPTVDVFASTAHQVALLLDSPFMQPAPFNLHDLRQTRVDWPTIDFIPAPTRPINLTYCVQLK
jgi:hypothetical protein